jgi:hypothetical protein
VNKGKDFLSFQMLSACWAIGKIGVRFAAGSMLFTEKWRAMNASGSLKNTLYFLRSSLWIKWTSVFCLIISSQCLMILKRVASRILSYIYPDSEHSGCTKTLFWYLIFSIFWFLLTVLQIMALFKMSVPEDN